MDGTDWLEWHRPYDDPSSPLSHRLRIVQARIAEALDDRPPGPIRVVSICAGQGRDLLPVLAVHPRRADVTARLVEADGRNVTVARSAAVVARLSEVDVVHGDASTTDAYIGAVPAGLVLLCGVFGNIGDADAARTIELLPQLCEPGAMVVWTRHRRPPDLTPAIRAWFGDHGFTELAFDAPADAVFSVGAHRLDAAPRTLVPGTRLFTFTGDGARPA